jgi:hypothetical protein
MANQTTPPMGAMPPPDATFQIGDRADKLCVIAAQKYLSWKLGFSIPHEDMQGAIDTYLEQAKKHGWKLT